MKYLKAIILIIMPFNLTWSKDFTFKQLEEIVLKSNPNIKEKELDLKETKSLLNKVESDNLPKVDLILGQENRLAPEESDVETEKNVAELRLNYNLYQFGTTKNQMQALEEQKKLRVKNIEYTKLKVTRDLKRLFFSTLAIRKHLELLKKEISYNKQLKSQVFNKKKQGLVGKADLLELNMREAILENTQIKLTEEYQHGLDLIRKISLIPHDQSITLKGDIPHTHLSTDLKELLKATKENNINLAKINSEVLYNNHQTDASFSKRLPSLKLRGRYGNMRIDETYTTNDSQEGLVGVYLEIPLFDGGKKSSEQAIQETKLKRSKQTLIKTKHELEIDLAHKFEKFQNIHRLLDLSEKNLANAKEYFKNVLSEYRRGVKNSLDLVSARDRLYQFNLDVIDYKKDYQLTKLELENISGLKL